MQEVAKHHRIIKLSNGHGKDQDWLAIDCAFVDSGVSYAKKNKCKWISFGSLDNPAKAKKVTLDILNEVPGLEGLIWQIPIPKKTDFAPLQTQTQLKYLSLVDDNLEIDLSSFSKLEYLGFSFSKSIKGYNKASKSLKSVQVYGVKTDLSFLSAVKNLTHLKIMRSDIDSLAGIEAIEKLEDLNLVTCNKLKEISHAAQLKKLKTFSADGVSTLTDLSPLQKCNTLKNIWLKNKKIKSCKFMASMKSLEFASINSEIGDNDLSPFLKSKTLKEIWFSPTKKSYSPQLSPDDINEQLAKR